MNYQEPGRGSAGLYVPDPVSTLFDAAAKRLLERAYARPGEFVRTRLANPGPRTVAFASARGINNLLGPDPVATSGGGLNARTRYCRAFVRAIYRQHKKSGMPGGIHVEVGRHIPASPQFDPEHPDRGGFPPGRAVQVLYRADKNKARAYMRNQPDSAKAIDNKGYPTRRWSNPGQRDW